MSKTQEKKFLINIGSVIEKGNGTWIFRNEITEKYVLYKIGQVDPDERMWVQGKVDFSSPPESFFVRSNIVRVNEDGKHSLYNDGSNK